MSKINKNAAFFDAEIIPHVFYQIYGMKQEWMKDDEVIYYSFDAGTYKDEESGEIKKVGTSTISVSPAPIDTKKNKYIVSKPVEVTITVGTKLKELYPYAIVKIDGKEFGLGVLDNTITFNMDNSHRISIEWCPYGLTETFRICPNR